MPLAPGTKGHASVVWSVQFVLFFGEEFADGVALLARVLPVRLDTDLDTDPLASEQFVGFCGREFGEVQFRVKAHEGALGPT